MSPKKIAAMAGETVFCLICGFELIRKQMPHPTRLCYEYYRVAGQRADVCPGCGHPTALHTMAPAPLAKSRPDILRIIPQLGERSQGLIFHFALEVIERGELDDLRKAIDKEIAGGDHA